MNAKVVDARGLACPQPVVLTLKALVDAEQVVTLVDNPAAVENVTRLARSKGFSVQVTHRPDGVELALTRDGAAPQAQSVTEHVVVCSTAGAAPGPLVLFVASDSLGRGPAELGERLMAAWFHALGEVATRPERIIFMNSGVKLVVEGARTVEDIRGLADSGIEVLACGTCLSYFGLSDKLAVGQVSNMYDIATALLEAGRIVEL